MDYQSLSRKELQAMCKNHGIRANTTNAAMIEALQSLNIGQDSGAEIGTCDAVVLENAGLNSPASITISCRRTPLKTSIRSLLRTTRSKREPEQAEEDELKSPAPGGIENLEEASRSVAPSGRRIMTRSARKQMEKIEIAEELNTPAKAVASLVPNSRRRPTRVSARRQTLQEGAEQEEAKGVKEALEKLRGPSLSSSICTRRSSRLRGKNQDSEAKQLEQKLEKRFIDDRSIQQPDAAGEPDQEISEELSDEPPKTTQETSSIEDNIGKIYLQLVESPAPVSGKYTEEPSGQTMTHVPGVNETSDLLKQSDQNDGAVGECLIDVGVPLCADEESYDNPTTTETSVASNKLSELFPQPQGSADAAQKVIMGDISASLMDVHGELPSFKADQVAVTSHESSTDAITLTVEVSDEAQVADQTTGALADLENEKLHQVHALEAGDGFIAEEASLNPLLPLPSEPENNVGEPLPYGKDYDSIPAAGEALQFPGIPVTSHEPSPDAIMPPVEVAQVVDQISGALADLEKDKLHQAHALEADDSFDQEASLNPVQPENNVSEPLSSGKGCDNIPEADEVLQFPETDVTSYEASADAIMLSFGIADEAQVVDQTTDGLANLEKEKVHRADASEAGDGFSPATDEVVQFPETALTEVHGVPSADPQHDPLVGEMIATSAAVIPDGFSDELQQIEEVNEKSASLGSWSAASPIPASLVVAVPGPELFMSPATDKSVPFPDDAHFENTPHASPAANLIATTPAVPHEVSGAFQQIEEANEKSPSFGSWYAASPGSEFSMVRKSGKSRSSVGSYKVKTLDVTRMFTSPEACVDKENKLMDEEKIVVDKKLNENNVGLAELEKCSLRKLRIMLKEKQDIKNKVQMNERTPPELEKCSLRKLRIMLKEKQGIKNKVQMNERTPLEALSANCLLGNENREIA